jgi:[acyl-carrier-protein] S-malonyltransferase
VPVFLFPGQGAQFTGMGMDLYAADADGAMGIRRLFDIASGVYGSDIREVLSADSDTLKRTDVSQIAITVASLAAVKALAAKGIAPSACAGFSLGEYPALAVSGVVSEEAVLKLVLARGRIMQSVADEIASASAASGAAPGMAAVLGLPPEAVDAAIADLVAKNPALSKSLFSANYNSPLQTVISGTPEGLDQAEAALKLAGARRVLRLKVAGPFHSPLMAKAGDEFSRVLEGVSFADPAIPLFSNVTGKRVSSGAEAKRCAVAHISRPVRWTDEEREIAELVSGGNLGLVECGPGKVLSGLWADSKLLGTCKPYTEA